MKITADTNILVRAVLNSRATDAASALQAERAYALLREAELIAVTVPSLCEFAWVLRSAYRYSGEEIGAAIRALCDSANVVTDRAAVEVGLATLSAGNDFSDGVIAHQGALLGGEVFCSFDRRAVRLLAAAGFKTHEP